jgi:hypothetical protein
VTINLKNNISDYETVCLDSISEIAEVVLSSEKKVAKESI